MKDGLATFYRQLDLVEYLVDDHVGVIRHLVPMRKDAGAPDLFCYYARACNTSPLGGLRNFPDAGGASVDRCLAMAKAVSEAVERYCAALYDPGDLPFCSYDSALFACVSPNEFALYSSGQYEEPQFPYVPFTTSTPIRWVQADNLTTGKVQYVPAAMVFAPYHFDHDPTSREPAIAQPISTGLACHCSPAEAALSGVCEVIERDAFSITWQARIAPPRIRLDTLPESNRDLISRFVRSGASVTLFNITMDHGISTVLAVLQYHTNDAPALVLAAAVHLDPEHAIRKCLEELELTRRLALHLKSNLPPFDPGEGFVNVNSQEDHVRLYCSSQHASLADFLFASSHQIAFREMTNNATGSPEEDLGLIIKELRKITHAVLITDLTTDDIRPLGLTVVRAVIPGFHPLFFGHRYRALGGRRLWSTPQELGYQGIHKASGDNSSPHPYP